MVCANQKVSLYECCVEQFEPGGKTQSWRGDCDAGLLRELAFRWHDRGKTSSGTGCSAAGPGDSDTVRGSPVAGGSAAEPVSELGTKQENVLPTGSAPSNNRGGKFLHAQTIKLVPHE